MTTALKLAPAANQSPPSLGSVLAALRVARARLGLLQLEIDEVGIALGDRMISPAAAIEWLRTEGLDQLVTPIGAAR